MLNCYCQLSSSAIFRQYGVQSGHVVKHGLDSLVKHGLDPISKTWTRFNLVPRACDPWEGNEGSGIIRCRKPGIVAKIELRIHFNGQSESSLKRIIPEPSFPSRGSQARGTRLGPD